MEKHINYKGFLILTLLLLNSCGSPEFTILTKVNLDGSCERTLKVKNLESKDLTKENLPVSIDSTWQITYHVDTIIEMKNNNEEDIYYDTTFFFKKTFNNILELNKEYSDTGNLYSILNRSVNLRKKFRWFYSFFEYQGMYGKLFEGQPVTNFLSDEELAALKDEDNDSLPLFEGLDSTGI